MQRRFSEHVVIDVGAMFVVMGLGIDVVLDEVMSLPVRSEGTTGLLIDERMSRRVGRQVSHVTQCISL